MLNHSLNNFKYGIMSKAPVNTLPDGAARDSMNWITTKGADGRGMIELRRGRKILGLTEQEGVGRVTGLKVGKKENGTEVPFFSYGRKVKYYDEDLDDTVEIGTDILPASASAEDISFAEFISRAGHQMWFNSPHTGPHKIMTSNPGSYVNMYDSTKNYKAHMGIFDNRAYNWRMDDSDKTTLRMSYIEVRGLSDYTQVSAESVTNGNALATKASQPKASFLDITGIGGAETFTEDLNGGLVGSAGGVGTINYATGVISFTPIAGAVATLTVTYRWVDETTTGGIANLVVPGSRVSGNPNVFQQLKGGTLQTVCSLKDHKFCPHEEAVWDVVPSLDDTETTNTIFRDTMGIPSLRAAYSAPEGIYTIDLRDPSEPKFVLIEYSNSTPDIKPREISKQLSLIDYSFSQAVVFPFNEYIVFACKTLDSTYNNRAFLYNTKYKLFDLTNYYISVADLYDGQLLAGDSLSNNVQILFSGLSDNDSVISNYWIGGITTMGIQRLKKIKKKLLEGYIGPDQQIHVYASLDRGQFVEITDSDGGAFIKGSGTYVDRSQRVNVGSLTLGAGEIGGGSDGIEAYHYTRQLPLRLGKFKEIQLKFVATEVGYASIIDPQFRDIRVSQDKPPRRYRST